MNVNSPFNSVHTTGASVAEKKRDSDKEYVILGIEEPEAHLHPHLQRLIFRDFFDLAKTANQPVLLTTHSPDIVSVSPLSSLTLIKGNWVTGSNVSSAAQLATNISQEEKDDLERYLDVSRSEIVFARGVILVEGIAEQYMLPKFFKAMKVEELGLNQATIEQEQIFADDLSLEQFGITICNINGVAFKPYVKLLKDINVPFAVLTDGDPVFTEDGSITFSGINRGVDLAKALFPIEQLTQIEDAFIKGNYQQVQMLLEQFGIFVNRNTFESELILSCYSSSFEEIISEFGAGQKMKEKVSSALGDFISSSGTGISAMNSLDYILNAIERYPCYGKGRFAQSLSTRSVPGIPNYIKSSFRYLISSLFPKR